MTLVIGGAYQGKLAYALNRFGLQESDVYFCSEEKTAMPQAKRVINGIDKWILALVRVNADVPSEITNFLKNRGDSIIICDDISCGVVPMDATSRKWRDAVGRAMAVVAQSSDEVVRLFCGIPSIIK